MDHPENHHRPLGSYDPDEPLVVRYADVIAARNAISALVVLLHDQQTPLSEYHAQTVAGLLPMGVAPDGADVDLLQPEQAAQFAVELRDRLAGCLPTPPSGPQN